jgi:hypothetical protein
MQLGQNARSVVRLGCSLLLFAALAGVWEILASQAPGTFLYIGMLPGPIELLREALLSWGFSLVLAGLLLADAELAARWHRALHLGAALLLGSGLYAGATGMHGVQISDLRPDATWLFGLKNAGRALLLAGLVAIARKAVLRFRAPR